MNREQREKLRHCGLNPMAVNRLLDYVDTLEAALIEIRDGSIKSSSASHKAREALDKGK